MTLQRVLEPEVMDSADDATDYNDMDHSAVNVLFADDFLATGFAGTDILDLGTGTALIPIEICQRNPEFRIMAADMAVSMLELARYNLEGSGLTNRIQLSHVDAKKLPYSDKMFGAVISNSIVHHIPKPEAVIREAIRVTKTAGVLFFRDLLRPAFQAELEQLVKQYAGDESDHARQLFADSLHAALSLEEIRTIVVQAGFEPDSVQQTSDRHWTWSGTK